MKLCDIIIKRYKPTKKLHQTDRSFAITLHGIGHCLPNLCKPDDALLHFKNALQIFEKMTLDTDNIFDMRGVAKNCDFIG